MNELKFLEVMGKIDDDLIKEAEIDIEQQYKIRQIKSRRKIYTLSSLAAAAVIVIGSAAFYKAYDPSVNPGGDSSIIISDDSTVTHSTSKHTETCVTTTADQPTVTAKSKATPAASTTSTASKVKSSSPQNNNNPQTTALSAVTVSKTNTTGNAAGTVTTSTSAVTENDYEYEGSNIMKKYAAALAAFFAASSAAAPLPSNAVENIYLPNNKDLKRAILTNKLIEECDIDTDINCDGKTDIFDSYAYFRAFKYDHYCQDRLSCQGDFDNHQIKERNYVGTIPDYIWEKYKAANKKSYSGEVVYIEPVTGNSISFEADDFQMSFGGFSDYILVFCSASLDYFDPNYYIDNCPDDYNDFIPNDVVRADIDIWDINSFENNRFYVKEGESQYRHFNEDDYNTVAAYDSYYADNLDDFLLHEDKMKDCGLIVGESPIYKYIENLRYSLNSTKRGFYLMEDFMGKEYVDADINSDGIYNFKDIITLAFYVDDCTKLYLETLDEYDEYIRKYNETGSTNYQLTESEYNKATKLFDTAFNYLEPTEYRTIFSYITFYYLIDHEVNPQYFDKSYYSGDKYHFDYNNFRNDVLFVETSVYQVFIDDFGPKSKRFEEFTVVPERFDFTYNDINNAFPTYYKNVKTGVLQEPDIDLNGKIDIADFVLLASIDQENINPCATPTLFKMMQKYPELQITLDIPREVRDNCNTNFDFNKNGISCDLLETECMLMYIYEEITRSYFFQYDEIMDYYEEHPELNYYELFNRKFEELKNSSENSDDIFIYADEMPKETNDMLYQLCNYTALFNHDEPETDDVEPNGDANIDGTVDLSDSVLIMQSISNPSKYGVKGSDDRHITEEGCIRADVDGEGVTNKDALTIQKYLLGLCSIK